MEEKKSEHHYLISTREYLFLREEKFSSVAKEKEKKKMIPEFIVIVANFAYNMYVCGKTKFTGCSGDIVEENEIIKVVNKGNIFISCKQSDTSFIK